MKKDDINFMSKIVLKNVKTLNWYEYGDPNGLPLLYFHGTPGSHCEAASASKIAKNLGMRVIALDRTGYGDSELHANTAYIDWPDIIVQLADKLHLDIFSILGYSGGGPYALACAHKIPERLINVTIVSSPASLTTSVMQKHMNVNFKPLYELADTDFQMANQQVSELTQSPEAFLELVRSQLSDSDRLIFERDEFINQYLKSLKHSLKQGSDATVIDLRNIAQPWKFNLEDIQPEVDIWHGDDDNNFDIAIADYLASRLNSTLHIVKKSGHYFLFDHWFEILDHIKNTIPNNQTV